ncbi:MAG: hypothetical protein HFJ60_07420 [Clostridia bacterium]|jgi:hypothetical protein|nr:hypothetical protein [Clostridia bacterium]
MNERKRNKGVVRRVVLKTIGYTLIIDISVIIILGIIFFLAGALIESMKLLCLTILIMDILPIYFYGSLNIREEKDKVKAETAERIFRKDDSTVVYPKVFPKKGHFRQRKFFEEELSQIADYYANLYEDGRIQVVAKIRDLNKILTIEYISKEDFIDCYDVLDTILTDTLN